MMVMKVMPAMKAMKAMNGKYSLNVEVTRCQFIARSTVGGATTCKAFAYGKGKAFKTYDGGLTAARKHMGGIMKQAGFQLKTFPNVPTTIWLS